MVLPAMNRVASAAAMAAPDSILSDAGGEGLPFFMQRVDVMPIELTQLKRPVSAYRYAASIMEA